MFWNRFRVIKSKTDYSKWRYENKWPNRSSKSVHKYREQLSSEVVMTYGDDYSRADIPDSGRDLIVPSIRASNYNLRTIAFSRYFSIILFLRGILPKLLFSSNWCILLKGGFIFKPFCATMLQRGVIVNGFLFSQYLIKEIWSRKIKVVIDYSDPAQYIWFDYSL